MIEDYRFSDQSYTNFFKALWAEPNKPPKVKLYSHTTYYVRAAIEAKSGIRYPLEQINKALKKGGHLPAADYGIPYWYRKKYNIA